MRDTTTSPKIDMTPEATKKLLVIFTCVICILGLVMLGALIALHLGSDFVDVFLIATMLVGMITSTVCLVIVTVRYLEER